MIDILSMIDMKDMIGMIGMEGIAGMVGIPSMTGMRGMTDMTDIPDMTDAISAGRQAKDRITDFWCRCGLQVFLPGKRRPQQPHHLCSYVAMCINPS